MSHDHGQEKKSINWGGLIKGLLAGAAIVAGALMIAPAAATAITAAGTALGAGTIGGSTLTSLGGFMAEGLGWLITKVAGAGLAYAGISYLASDKQPETERHAEHYHEARESFAMREDMRKYQAVMMARMQANGYAPAAQMASQQGRG